MGLILRVSFVASVTHYNSTNACYLQILQEEEADAETIYRALVGLGNTVCVYSNIFLLQVISTESV